MTASLLQDRIRQALEDDPPAQSGMLAATLYVSPSLEWFECPAECLACVDRDVTIDGVPFRRLDADYLAWLRSRVALAEKLANERKLPANDALAMLVKLNEISSRVPDSWAAVVSQPAYVPPRKPEEPTVELGPNIRLIISKKMVYSGAS